MAQEDAYRIIIHRFWTEYKPTPDGSMRGIDWIEYSPIGGARYLRITEAVARLAPIKMEGKNADNPAVKIAQARWDYIQPHYEAWKKGNAAPTTGTPLAAWNGVSPGQSEILKLHGIFTVEDISQMTDAHKRRVGLPALDDLVNNAKRYLTALDKNVVAKALEQKDAEIADLKAQMEHLAGLVKKVTEAPPSPVVVPLEPVSVAGETNDPPPVKRGRGRPRKIALVPPQPATQDAV